MFHPGSLRQLSKGIRMDKQALLLASLLGGILSIILCNTPFLNLINILLCAGFWLGALFAVWFYKSRVGAVSLREGILIGFLSGVWAAIFGIALSFVGLAGASALANSFTPLLPANSIADLKSQLDGIGGFMFTICGGFVDIFFGVVGGLIGGALFRQKT
jgi:hypothetical protein